MSHTIRKVNLGNSALVEVTIVDYVQGGESFTLSELGLTGALVSAFFLTSPGSLITPVLSGAKVILNNSALAFIFNIGQEIASQVGLNYTFFAIVHGT